VIAGIAAISLVVVHWSERDVWFWLGLTALVLNLLGWVVNRSSLGTGLDGQAPAQGQSLLRGPSTDGESFEYSLAELFKFPGVVAAFKAGPHLWRQVSYLDESFDPASPYELAEFMWIENDGEWAIGLGDEVKPFLDLDVDETDDPLLDVLRSHPFVKDAYHEDREVYRIEQRQRISTEVFAELAARALVAHHTSAATQGS
jgi:hypothetical protein